MSNISANELKTKGISSIEYALSNASEAVLSVRGKDKFVVMDMDGLFRSPLRHIWHVWMPCDAICLGIYRPIQQTRISVFKTPSRYADALSKGIAVVRS